MFRGCWRDNRVNSVVPTNSAGVVGYVVIGRNEGERLRVCLESVLSAANVVVYVDSGSTDGSVRMAQRMGANVVNLDLSVPFTAARARNEGFRRLRDLVPDLEYVHYVDGDCELVDGWQGKAVQFLDEHKNVAVVCGRLRERYPEKSIYNMLCDMEWDATAGAAKSCGGISMMRVKAFETVHGFRADLIAGEEPELCVRLRASGWHVWRLGDEMAFHDAAMLRFGQWWKRTVRAGYAYAQAAVLHGAPPELHGVSESRSAWFWGAGVPTVIIGLAIGGRVWALALVLIYPIQVTRLALKGHRGARENWWRALFLVLGKFPEWMGQLKYRYHAIKGRQAALIEYK